jgi:ribonuclease HI
MADKARMLERLAARLDLSEPERAALHEAAAYFRATQSDGSGERSAASRPSSSPDGSQTPEAILWSDGAARGNPGPAGAGAVLKRPNGEVLAEVSGFLGHTTNNVAEYKALLMGLDRALNLGIRRIEVRADSELLIKQLRGEYRVKDEKLKLLFAEAKALLARFASTKLLHVRREQNADADRLANAGIDSR